MSVSWAVFAGLCLTAAVWDFRKYIIPNAVCALLVAWFVVAALVGGVIAETVWHWAVAAGVLAGGYLLYLTTGMGAGDAKLASAVALWAGPGAFYPLTVGFAVAMALLAFGLILLRRILAATLDEPPSMRALQIKSPAPLGVAIAAAAVGASRYYNEALWTF